MLMEIAANAGDQEKQNLNSFAIIEPIKIMKVNTNYYGIHLNRLRFREVSSLNPTKYYTKVMKIKVVIFYSLSMPMMSTFTYI